MSWFWLPLLHLWSLFLCLYNSQFPAELVRCVCNICGDRGSELDLSPEPVRPCSAAQWWLHFFICSPSTECSGDVPSDAEVMVNWESLDEFFCAIADKDNSSFCCFLHVHCKRFFLYAQEMLFSFKQPVYHIRAGKPRYSGWHMESWSGKGAYAYSVCDLDQKSNPEGSICFDSLLGLNLKKPSGQSMASCLRFAFSFAYYLLTGSLLERIKPYQLFSEARGRCRDISLDLLCFCNINNGFSFVLHARLTLEACIFCVVGTCSGVW